MVKQIIVSCFCILTVSEFKLKTFKIWYLNLFSINHIWIKPKFILNLFFLKHRIGIWKLFWIIKIAKKKEIHAAKTFAQTSDFNTDTCAVTPILNLCLTSENKSQNLNIYLLENNTMKNFLKSCKLKLFADTYFVITADVLFIVVATKIANYIGFLMRKIKEFYED